MITTQVEAAVSAGARRTAACGELGIDPRTLERWRASGLADDGRTGPRQAPRNKLTPRERARIIAVATSPEGRDLSPKQLVPRLADEGKYVGSESTVYRVLRAEKLMAHRGRAAAPVPRPRAEHVAVAPCQVWSWDITYLRTTVRGSFYYLYMMMDVWSRKIVGFAIHEVESPEHASVLLREALANEKFDGRGLVLHADNGGPMKGATMKATMEKLEVHASYSRPRVSDDNAFSESLFRTLKYRPEYPPGAFASLDDARAWVTRFVGWYNEVHLHSAIGFVTPTDRHAGRGDAILAARAAVYKRARRRHPERWSGAARAWQAPAVVRLNPSDHLYVSTPQAAVAA